MKRKSKWAIGSVLGLSFLLLLGWAVLGRGQDPVVYTVDPVKREDLRETTNANGQIQARTRVNVGVQVTAAIKVIHVKDGQYVPAGTLLVTLEQENYRQSLTQAEVGLRMAHKDLAVAQVSFSKQQETYRRKQALKAVELLSAEDFDQARLERDTAEAVFGRATLAVQQAAAQVAIAQDALGKTEIRASMAGWITDLKAEKGETAVAGQTSIAGAVLMVIADTSELLAEVKVGELDVVKLRVGQPAEIQVDAAPGQVFQGRVLEVATSVDRSNQTFGGPVQDLQNYRVRVQLLGSSQELEGLHPGMSARAVVLAKELKGVLSVPLQAIQERETVGGGLGLMKGSCPVVFVVKDGLVQERTLKTGGGTRQALEVLEGLAEGEQLITGPAKAMAALVVGSRIKTQSEQEALRGRFR